jgi:hypothetical protein
VFIHGNVPTQPALCLLSSIELPFWDVILHFGSSEVRELEIMDDVSMLETRCAKRNRGGNVGQKQKQVARKDSRAFTQGSGCGLVVPAEEAREVQDTTLLLRANH